MLTSTRRRLQIVYAVVFLAFLDNFAMLPTVGPYARALGADPAGVGVAVAAYSLTNLAFNVIGGYLLDRAGRKRLAVAGLAVAGSAVALYAAVGSPSTLVAARLLHGAAGGVLVPALFTLVGDLAEQGSRGRAMGRAGAFIGAAAVVGPAVAGVLRGAAGFSAVFGVVAALLALGALIAAALVRETAPSAALDAPPAAEPSGRVLSRPELWIAMGAVFAFTAAFGTLAAFLPDDVEALGASAALSGGLFATVSGIAALLMLTPAAQWVDRAGPGPPVRAGMLLFAAALGLLAVGGSVALAAAASVVFGVGFGLLFPAATGAVAIAAPLQGRGRAFGLFNAAYSLGFIVGAPLAGAAASATRASPYSVPLVLCAGALVAEVATRRRAGAKLH